MTQSLFSKDHTSFYVKNRLSGDRLAGVGNSKGKNHETDKPGKTG